MSNGLDVVLLPLWVCLAAGVDSIVCGGQGGPGAELG